MFLPRDFYTRKDVTEIARDLVGKVLFTKSNGKTTGGLIVEVEAYSHMERGCHAYQNKMTNRNKIMFGVGGVAYVYLCYGIHHMFNVVTNEEGVADAVLIRALEPVEGINTMVKRMKARSPERITSGPGKLTRAMGIDLRMYGKDLFSKNLWIEDIGRKVAGEIKSSKRIGIDYAGKDALLPWRFTLKNNLWVSK